MPAIAALQGIGVYNHNIPFAPAGTYVTTKMSDFNPVYMNQWNLNIQRQFGQNWLVTANYVGNNTIHMITTENINPAVYFPTQTFTGAANNVPTCTLPNGVVATGAAGTTQCSTTANQQNRRLLNFINPNEGKNYAGVGLIDDGGTASYEALNLSVQKRISGGLSGQANYTWSHCISDVYADNPTAAGVSPTYNRRQFRGNCLGIDRRQVFSSSLVATTPKFSSPGLRMAASNWQFAPILSISSAQLFTVFAGSDQALTTVGNQTPNLVDPSAVYPANQTSNNWINRAAFSAAAPGTYGNVGYNTFKGPHTVQLNMAVSRTFAVREKTSIQVRAEAFNLPNHVNMATPGAGGPGGIGRAVSLTAPNFSQITSDISGNSGLNSGDYRIIQFAMKLIF
jgi:hypothetical protein